MWLGCRPTTLYKDLNAIQKIANKNNLKNEIKNKIKN